MTDDLPATSQDPKPARKGRISKRMKQVLTLLATKGMTQRDAAKHVGMSETYLSTALKKPEIQAFISQRVRQSIAVGTLRAGERLLDLLDAGSEHVSLDASKHVLGIAGIKPDADAAVNVNIEVKAGWVIDVSPAPGERPDVSYQPPQPPVIDVTPTFGRAGDQRSRQLQAERLKPIPQPDPYPVFRPPKSS
jgi:hypothetical protein